MGEVSELIPSIIEIFGDILEGFVTQKYTNQFKTNCVGFVSLTILLWDHIVTFSDEVEYVWYGRDGPRVVLLVEFVMNTWLLTKGGPVPLGLGCEMIYVGVSQAVASSSAWLPLLFDTLAFLLIFWATFNKEMPGNATFPGQFNVYKRMLEDGLLYYCPILFVTLSLSLMISFSEPGSQNLVAQLELIITVTMMSRITINLKKAYHKKKDIDIELANMPNPVHAFAEHARAQISSVLDITRSRIQNEPSNDVEMTEDCAKAGRAQSGGR
ncbi:hypothetical protein AGABI2DRAFT_119270 [Agaricus bisporus var. bisporus H97]|uniref:hypothetical protein n=1 Tax=Agaricus bisporus var. bisporus (strain H97 / ATCC MYA-4626 / FGSC 10389) TaxID=936046 RepID=UPI00029F7B93|nr:hypothetical protein AGABI2DRAFT_119270 [Agaricus bisporus var. bisporus H97]EKV45593.1 hypothetical protein AGABI2DRAFT_119270 [Agaricus bisporus var. bisporus H97]